MARIVFCEDEEQIRKVIALSMRSTAHAIEITTSGREALAAIERLAPDLIVTDVTMPEMTGFALAAAIRARPSFRHIPILFMTALVQRGEIAEFASRGAAASLAKPFSPSDLRATIDALLARAVS